MTIVAEAKVLSAKTVGNGVEVIVQKKDGTQETLKADIALNAIGVQGNIEGIGIEENRRSHRTRMDKSR